MPDEVDEFPSVFIIETAAAPGWHSAEPNSVLDRVVELTIRLCLSFPLAHIRSGRIEIAPYFCISAPVICMAVRAMICPMRTGFLDNLLRVRHGVMELFCLVGDSDVSRLLGQ